MPGGTGWGSPMANFDMAELALKSVCPNNAMKYDDKEKLHRTAEADTGSADIGEEETQCEPIST